MCHFNTDIFDAARKITQSPIKPVGLRLVRSAAFVDWIISFAERQPSSSLCYISSADLS